MRPAMLLAMLGGCNAVFGVDEIGPIPDAPKHLVGGVAEVRRILNDAMHDSILSVEPYASKLVVRDASGEREVTITNGQFSFEATAPYEAVFLASDGIPTQVDSDAEMLHYGDKQLGRASPAQQGTTTVQGATDPAEYVVIHSTGLWTSTPVIVASDSTYTLAWTDAMAQGPRGLLDGQLGDALYALHYRDGFIDRGSTTVYSRLVRMSVDYGTMTNGSTVSMAAATPLSSAGMCYSLLVDREVELRRIRDVFTQTTNPFSEWSLETVPVADESVAGRAPFAYHRDTTLTPIPITGQQYDLQLANGGDLVAHRIVQASFPSHAAGFDVTPIVASTVYQRVPPAASDCSTSIDLTGARVALPYFPSVAGVALVAPNNEIVLDRTKPIPISWSIASPGPVEMFSVNVVEAIGTNTVRPLYRVLTTKMESQIPPDVFVSGHGYLIQISTVVGFPGASAGDVTTIAYPFAFASASSHGFTVK